MRLASARQILSVVSKGVGDMSRGVACNFLDLELSRYIRQKCRRILSCVAVVVILEMMSDSYSF